MENNKNMPKKYMKALSNVFFLNSPHWLRDIVFFKLYKDGENILVSFFQTSTLLEHVYMTV